jgi:hypothetical protein
MSGGATVRCEGCDGKFGANGDVEAEEDSRDISDDTITADVTLSMECANCGTRDWRTASASIETQIDLDQHNEECVIADPDNSAYNPDGIEEPVEVTLESDRDRFIELTDKERYFEITEASYEVGDDYVPKVKERTLKDGTVKRTPVPHRYRRHIYTVTGTFSVRCSSCGGDFEVTGEAELSAGEFEASY